MTDTTYNRRLAAVLAADVVGYSRLMGADEGATLSTLKSRRELFVQLIRAHRGRVVNAPGDAILAEFGSVGDALTTALEAQREFASVNADLPPERRMAFRIGVNLGDVLEEGGGIYGDAVNVAARLESLAPPGGICVSARVRDSVRNHPEFSFSDMGVRTVKNIGYTLRAYQLSGQGEHPAPAARWLSNVRHATSRRLRIRVAAVAAVAAVMLASGAFWYVSAVRVATVPERPRPSIAVLPFQVFGPEDGIEAQADGLSEDLITDLAQVRDLDVIARNTTFRWKGRAVHVSEVGQELGVQYVLEGSLRPSQDELQITAQLIDARTGTHDWAGRYSVRYPLLAASLEDVRRQIVTELEVELVEGAQARRWRAGTTVDAAYSAFLQGDKFFFAASPNNMARAREMFQRAVALDPAFAQAHAKLAATYVLDVKLGAATDDEAHLRAAREHAQRALELDPALPQAWVVISQAALVRREYETALDAARRARDAAPSDSHPAIALGLTLLYAGDGREARVAIRDAAKLGVFPPPFFHSVAGRAAYVSGRTGLALEEFQRNIARNPEDFRPYVLAAIALEELGRPEEAIKMLAKVYELAPGFSPERYMATSEPYKDQVVASHMLANLLHVHTQLMLRPGDALPWL